MGPSLSQEDYFSSSGGDDYFERNSEGQGQPYLGAPAFELLRGLSEGTLPARGRATVLGGSGGRIAAGLSGVLPGWKLTNVDISAKAIDFGRTAFAEFEHYCLSITSKAPDLLSAIGDQDLIYVAGVLLWVDRRSLARAVANIDESLRDGGHLLITDFLPSGPRRNPIRHSPEHYTYKQDYSAPFLSLGTYELVSMNSHIAPQRDGLSVDERRSGHHLLRKDLSGLYPIGWSG